MHFIQLSKFLKEGDEKEVRKAMERNKEIAKANKELEYLTGDEEVQRVAFLREKYEKDYNTNISGARKEGVKEGEKLAKIEIAKEMLKQGIDIELIKDITKLKIEEIKEIKQNLKDK